VDPGDARAVRIRITAEGLQTLNRVRADRASAIEPQLARLNDADRQTLGDAVTVLRGLLEDAAAVRDRVHLASAAPPISGQRRRPTVVAG